MVVDSIILRDATEAGRKELCTRPRVITCPLCERDQRVHPSCQQATDYCGRRRKHPVRSPYLRHLG